MSGSKLRIFSCDHHEIPLPPGHKFPLAKYRLLRERIATEDLFQIDHPPPADPNTIALAHDPAYVQAFLAGSLDSRIMRRIGFPWSPGLVARTLCSVGATLAATAEALETGFSGALAGGTHHAFYSEGSGFCVFNDIAVAIKFLGKRAAVIDLDVHQGDGTAAIFSGDPSVFTLSLHGAQNFPLVKQKSSMDIAFPDGTEDTEYLSALKDALPAAIDFAPEIIFYQAGVDALASDHLGRLSMTQDGLAARDRLVFEAAKAGGIPVVVVVGGGYSNPIGHTVDAHATTFRVAAQIMGRPAPTSR